MNRASTPTATRRSILSGVAGLTLATAGVAAQETTDDGETATDGGTTTDDGGTTTTDAENTTVDSDATTFRVRIENVSPDDALTPSEGEPEPVILSPGVYAVHTDPGPLFTPGEPDPGEGLEAIAEDGIPTQLAESLDGREGVSASGVFDTSTQMGDPGPIAPGEAYEFEFPANEGDALSFATMFVPSNDLFFAPEPEGIRLFEDGEPVSGETTQQVALWDAGTEVNEEPGVGENQVQNQPEPDTGPDEDAPIRRIDDVDDGFEYPSVETVLRVTVGPADERGTVTTVETTATTATTATDDGAELEVGTATETAEQEATTETE